MVQKKIVEEITTKRSPILTKDKLINPASSASPKQDKLKEIHAQIHHDQTTKNQRKRKTLKAAKEK